MSESKKPRDDRRKPGVLKIKKVSDASGVTVLRLDGSLSVEVVGKLESALRGVMDRDRPGLVLNLSGLDYISSAGVGILVGYITELRNAGGDLVFVNPSDHIREVFGLLGFTKLFRIMEKEEDAVGVLTAT